jgi:hypothetical protein
MRDPAHQAVIAMETAIRVVRLLKIGAAIVATSAAIGIKL